MLKTLAIVAIIVIAIALLAPTLRNPSVSNLPLEEKMDLAESYQQALQKEGNALFASLRKSEDMPDDVRDFNDILQEYTKRINSLHLPCPTSSETQNDPTLRSYLSWAENFEAKDKKVMAAFQHELNQLLK